MPKFLIDEDLPRLLAALLLKTGHPAQHVLDLNLRGAKDAQVFAAAQELGAVRVSGDGDFANLLRFPLGGHHGIVVVEYPSVMRTRQLSTELADTLSLLEDDFFKGSMVILEPGRMRVRRPRPGSGEP